LIALKVVGAQCPHRAVGRRAEDGSPLPPSFVIGMMLNKAEFASALVERWFDEADSDDSETDAAEIKG
jgi:hypothetical protein